MYVVLLCEQISNFTRPCPISPQQTAFLFSLKFHPNTTMLQFTTDVYLHTNTSVFKIPIYVYHGRLKVIFVSTSLFWLFTVIAVAMFTTVVSIDTSLSRTVPFLLYCMLLTLTLKHIVYATHWSCEFVYSVVHLRIDCYLKLIWH